MKWAVAVCKLFRISSVRLGLLVSVCMYVLSVVLPVQVYAFQADAEWVDAATIKVNSIGLEEKDAEDSGVDWSDEFNANGLQTVNAWINQNDQAAGGKLYKIQDLVDNLRESQTEVVYKAPTPCEFVERTLFGDPKTANTYDIDLGGGLRDSGENGDFVFDILGFRTGGDAETGCHFVIKGQQEVKKRIPLKNANRRNIWFRAENKDTLVRVDGKDGKFVRSKTEGRKNRFVREDAGGGNCGDTRAYVAIGNDGNVEASLDGNIIGATYETCDRYGFFNVDVSGLNDPQNNGGSDNTESGAAPPSCESNNSGVIMSWLLCGMINFLDDSLTKLALSVDGLLDVKQEEYNDPDGKFKEVWSYVKNISSFLLVAAVLVVIIGQAVRG